MLYSLLSGLANQEKPHFQNTFFPDKPYFSLENPDVRNEIEEDPNGFLISHKNGAILDEFQRIPQLTSYLQQIVDKTSNRGDLF